MTRENEGAGTRRALAKEAGEGGEGRRNGDHQGGDDESQGEGEGGGQPDGAKHRKLELPIFEGEDPLG